MLESASSNPPGASTEQRELTLLFADLRDFTELSAELEIAHTDLLLGQVMDCFTAAVLDHRGMVVDYYGDGLAAMWNAPNEEAEHPALACRAALSMIESLPAISRKWADVIGVELRVGIGLHTGVASVGNAGSSRHAKYGPRGPSVHLASRLEAATKELSLSLVVSHATAERLPDEFAAHRVCHARLPGLTRPVDLYAVQRCEADSHVACAWQQYGEALQHFEEGRLAEAACALAQIEVSTTAVPVSFLATRIEVALNAQQHRRRNTDRVEERTGGVIRFEAK